MAIIARAATLLLALCLNLCAGGTESQQLIVGGSHAKSLARKLLDPSSRFLQVLEEVIEPRLSAVMDETLIEPISSTYSDETSLLDKSADDSSFEESSPEDSSSEESSAEESSSEESSLEESSGGAAPFAEGSRTHAVLTHRAMQEVDEGSTITQVPEGSGGAEDSSGDDSSVEDSSAEDSSVEDSSAEDSSVEHSTAEDSSAEDSSSEDSSTEVISASQLIEAVY
mmetsp:Transcript_2360/g.3935  ORF Transcript_2360/g.3935 Transcript_2360/m.3935 type:complete len:226 (-) Transcript_2360:1304-1981(-)